MKKSYRLVVILLIFLLLSAISCDSLRRDKTAEYGELNSAIIAAAEVVKGKYGQEMPSDFTSSDFLKTVKDSTPNEYPMHWYNLLQKYDIKIKPKGKYYLLLAFDQRTESLVLYHYSRCTQAEIVAPDPSRYILNHIELFDTCK